MSNLAKLRVCASCEWVFHSHDACPKCGFGHYGAHYVYGKKAYTYAISQKPWFDKKMADYSFKLQKEIKENQEVSDELTRKDVFRIMHPID